MKRFRAALAAATLAFPTLFMGALPAEAGCRVVNGELVCDDAPRPRTGGGNIHPAMLDKLVIIIQKPIEAPGQ